MAAQSCGGERSRRMEDVGSDGATVQGASSQDIVEGERADHMPPPDPPPPSESSFSRRTGHGKSATVKNYGMETEDLFVPTDFQALSLSANLGRRQVWDQSYMPERRKKWLSSSSILELLLAPDFKQQQVCEDNCEVAVTDVGWWKKWVAAAMDLGSRMKWGACAGMFFVLMLVISTIPHDEDCHDFADQRTLLLGIPNTLNVISTSPFFFVGLTGLILNHSKSSQGGLYALFFAGIISVGFGSFCYHLNPKNATLFWDTLPMMVAFTSLEAVFVIERFDNWAGTKSLGSTRYWLWAAGFYVFARVEEVADKPIYRWTLQIVSGHTLGHLSAAMVPLFLIMLAKRTRPIEPERHRIPMHHQLKLTFMVCLLVPKIIFLWVPKIQVSAIMYEISSLMWEFGAHCMARSVNQAKTSEERAMLETPIRAREIVPRIRGLRGMDIYKNKVLAFLQSEGPDESVFGLWGVSGVGKTRLLSLIADSYADSFRYVIFLDGGSSVTVMQNHLAYFLKLDWEAMSLLPEDHCRAKILTKCLENNSFLLLLDDVQDGYYPDLTAVGLPIALGRRQKVIITSRSQVVCGGMGCTMSNTLEMKCLGDEDAWSLFKYNVGVEITEADAEICEFAKEMVSACEGLPRAICAIGRGVAGATCRGKHPVDWWFAHKRFKAKNLPPERMEEIVAVFV